MGELSEQQTCTKEMNATILIINIQQRNLCLVCHIFDPVELATQRWQHMLPVSKLR